MSPERQIQQIAKLPTKELRTKVAQAWRRLRRNHPELARLLWKGRKQKVH